MKKIISLFLVVASLFILSACSNVKHITSDQYNRVYILIGGTSTRMEDLEEAEIRGDNVWIKTKDGIEYYTTLDNVIFRNDDYDW